MQRATLLSWTFVGDMNWVMFPQQPYAIGWTWEPLWSNLPWEGGKSSSDFGPSWSFSKFMLRTTLAQLGSCGGYRLPTYIESPQHPYAINLTWEPHWSRILWEKMIKVGGQIQNIISQTCIFSDFFLVLFLRLNFYFRTCIFSNAFFCRQ